MTGTVVIDENGERVPIFSVNGIDAYGQYITFAHIDFSKGNHFHQVRLLLFTVNLVQEKYNKDRLQCEM